MVLIVRVIVGASVVSAGCRRSTSKAARPSLAGVAAALVVGHCVGKVLRVGHCALERLGLLAPVPDHQQGEAARADQDHQHRN